MEVITKSTILELIPEINLIQDKSLKEKSLNTFLKALKQGGWSKNKLAKCPVSLKKVKVAALNNQFEHIRNVTKIALHMFDTLASSYKKDFKNRDIVIAGALLHDVGKFLEFVPQGEEVVYAANANLMRHPLSGAILASAEGLPDEVIHIIAVHSFEGKESYESLESMLVKAADEAAFKYIAFFND